MSLEQQSFADHISDLKHFTHFTYQSGRSLYEELKTSTLLEKTVAFLGNVGKLGSAIVTALEDFSAFARPHVEAISLTDETNSSPERQIATAIGVDEAPPAILSANELADIDAELNDAGTLRQKFNIVEGTDGHDNLLLPAGADRAKPTIFFGNGGIDYVKGTPGTDILVPHPKSHVVFSDFDADRDYVLNTFPFNSKDKPSTGNEKQSWSISKDDDHFDIRHYSENNGLAQFRAYLYSDNDTIKESNFIS